MLHTLGLLVIVGAAPLPSSPVTSPADAVVRAAQDIKRFQPYDQLFQRYLWVAKPSARLRVAWKLHLNFLSRYQDFIAPEQITPWLWRIDVRWPIWDPAVIENAVEVDVFFHKRITEKTDKTYIRYWPGGKDRSGKEYPRGQFKDNVKAGQETFVGAPWLPLKELNELRAATFSEAPVLMAEWLFAQSCRQLSLRRSDKEGLGYANFLGFVNRDEYFKVVGLPFEFSRKFGVKFNAALDRSKVSPQNRQMGRLGGVNGGVWFTLDTDVQKDAGIAIAKLKRGEFKHIAEEWIGPLKNGLPGAGLFDDKGVLQAIAPGDKIGLHDNSPLNESVEKSLHLHLACQRCHAKHVLMPFTDEIREQFKAGERLFLGSSDVNTDLELREVFLTDVYKYLAKDQLAYVDAFQRATTTDEYPAGLTVEAAVKVYARTFHAYADDDVTQEVAARELGVSKEVMLRALVNAAKPPELGGKAALIGDTPLQRFIRKTPMPLTRLTWENRYSLLQDFLAADRARGLKP